MKATSFCLLLQLCMLMAAGQATRVSPNLLLTSTYIQEQTNAFSFAANQAALAYTSTFMAGVYSERRFMLQEISWHQAMAALPTKSGNFGLKSTYFGGSVNAEMEIGLAYGRKLGEKLAIGGQFNYYTQRISQYQSSHAISIEAGVLLKINEQVQAGFHIYNPNNASLGKAEENLPAIYTVGLGYAPSDRLCVTNEIQKIEDEKINIKAAISYQFDKRLYAKAGINTVNAVYVLGGGVKLSNISLEVTTSIHPQLGITPGLLVLFHKKEKGS